MNAFIHSIWIGGGLSQPGMLKQTFFSVRLKYKEKEYGQQERLLG